MKNVLKGQKVRRKVPVKYFQLKMQERIYV